MKRIIYKTDEMGNQYTTMYQDEFGNPITRTPQTNPYSYDGFVTYRNGENKEANCTIYSDRLIRENYKLVRDLMQKHFGNQGDSYSQRNPKDIERFLAEYLNKDVKIIFIMEYCNVSSGYPLWRFDIKVSNKN